MTDDPKIHVLNLDAIEEKLNRGFSFGAYRRIGRELVAALRAEHAARVAAERRATTQENRSNLFRDEARRLADDLKRYTLPPEVVTVLAREAVIGFEGLRDSVTTFDRESVRVDSELGEIGSALHELRTRYHLETSDADLVKISGECGPIANLHARIEKLDDVLATAHEYARTLELDNAALRRVKDPDFDTFPDPGVLELLACVVERSDAVELSHDERTANAEKLEALAAWIDAARKARDDG
jgi:hypothetical protein